MVSPAAPETGPPQVHACSIRVILESALRLGCFLVKSWIGVRPYSRICASKADLKATSFSLTIYRSALQNNKN